MAQLKDSVVSGNLRVTDTTLTDTLQVTTVKAPTTAGGTTYGPGTSGQVLKTNGTSVYWGADSNAVTGVKGNAESTYRTGDVNLTPANIGAVPNTRAGMNAAINLLDTGSSTPVDGDYYISQYVGGGTTTTTYHRRPMSALASYVRTKLSVTSSGSGPVVTGMSYSSSTGVLTYTKGRVLSTSGGQWIAGRDNAPLFANSGSSTTGNFFPAIAVKSNTGAWSIGTLGSGDSLAFSFSTDTNYSGGTNTTNNYYIGTDGAFTGTAAGLTTKAVTASTVNTTPGSFVFGGTNVIGGINDWVGFQADAGNDRFQIIANSQLVFRQNDAATIEGDWGSWLGCITPNNVSGDTGITITKTTTTIGTGDNALTYDSGVKISHTNSISAQTSEVFKKFKYDAQGHITGVAAVAKADITALGIPAQDTTYSAGDHLSLSSTTFSLANYCKTITDWNDAKTDGWYMGSGVTNAPSTAWWMGRVTAHNAKYCIQEVWQFTASTDGHKVPHKMRMYVNEVWGNWVDITVGTAVPENAVFTDANVTVTKLAASTADASYYATFASAAGTSGLNIMDSIKFNHTKGTTSAVGNSRLILGNSTASGTANNEEGLLRLYSPGTSYHTIKGASTNSAVDHTLPTTGGTILNTGTTGASTTNGKVKINGSDVTVYTHPTATAQSSGLYKITVNGTGHVTAATAAGPYAGSSSDGGPANLLAYTHSNEINFSGGKKTTCYFNYRDADTDAEDTGETPIAINYKFCDYRNSTANTTITAANFDGNATSANTLSLKSLAFGSTLNTTNGLYAFTTTGSIYGSDTSDWVGMQIGSSGDRFQIMGSIGGSSSGNGTMLIRGNDTADSATGRDTNWSNWSAVMTADTIAAGTGITLSYGYWAGTTDSNIKTSMTIGHSNSIGAQSVAVFKKFSYDACGHITGVAAVAKADIPQLDYIGAKSDGSYWGMTTPANDDTQWIRTSQRGIIPYKTRSADATSTTIGDACNLGTQYWYFAESYIQYMYGTAEKADRLRANSTVTVTNGVQYARGGITVGTEDGNAAEGSNASYKLWSYPTGATSVSGGLANIQNLRLYWSSTYFRDIFISPNNQDIYHRSVSNGTAKAWRKILDSTNYTDYTYSSTASRTANYVLAAPNGSAGAATFRKLVADDLPSHTHSYLPLSGGGPITGTVTFGSTTASVNAFEIYTKAQSNYVKIAKWSYGATWGTYGAEIGYYNQYSSGTEPGDKGQIIILPYQTTTQPWNCTVGLCIKKEHVLIDGVELSKEGHKHVSTSGGQWISARDNAPLYVNPSTTSSSYFPALFAKTKSGGWSIGVLGGSSSANDFYVTYTTDTDYNAETNQNTYQITFPKDSGTLALTKNCVAKSGDTVTGILTMYREGTTAQNYPAGFKFSVKDTTTGQTYNDKAYIYAYQDHASTTYGTNMVINSGGCTFIGAGEAGDAHYSAIKENLGTSEYMYLTADAGIYIQGKGNSIANRCGIYLDNAHNIVPCVADTSTNNVGSIGTSSYKWNAAYFNNTYSESVGKNCYIAYPDGGIYNVAGSSSVEGAFLITTPITTSQTCMVKFTVDIYNGVKGTSTEYKISGFANSDGKWYYTSAIALGGTSRTVSNTLISNLTVRFGYQNNKFCVQIGEVRTSNAGGSEVTAGTKWAWPKVVIHDIMITHNATSYDTYKSGWSISLFNTENTPISNITATHNNTNVSWAANTAALSHSNELNFSGPDGTGSQDIWFGYRKAQPDGTETKIAYINNYKFGNGNGQPTAGIKCGQIEIKTGTYTHTLTQGSSMTSNRTIMLPDTSGLVSVWTISWVDLDGTGATQATDVVVPDNTRYLKVYITDTTSNVSATFDIQPNTTISPTAIMNCATVGQTGLELILVPLQFSFTNEASGSGYKTYTLGLVTGAAVRLSASTTPQSGGTHTPKIKLILACCW